MSKEPQPQRPPPMSLSDLSMYHTDSPHNEYKGDNICPKHKELMLHKYLLPMVKRKRKVMSAFLTENIVEIKKYFNDALQFVKDKKKEFIEQARNPDYLLLRQGFVATSGVLGFVAGRRMGTFKDSILKGVFTSAFALFATGCLCFPDETDEYFRTVCYYAAQGTLGAYNVYANDNRQLGKKRLPCIDELPEKPC